MLIKLIQIKLKKLFDEKKSILELIKQNELKI